MVYANYDFPGAASSAFLAVKGFVDASEVVHIGTTNVGKYKNGTMAFTLDFFELADDPK